MGEARQGGKDQDRLRRRVAHGGRMLACDAANPAGHAATAIGAGRGRDRNVGRSEFSLMWTPPHLLACSW